MVSVTGSAVGAVWAGDLDELRDLVGTEGPVVGVGNGTCADGGDLMAGTVAIAGPSGVVSHDPAELTVRCGAATTVDELDAVLAETDQRVALDPSPAAGRTVGGVLAEGRSGITRLRHGPLRDHVLEVRFVSAFGDLATAGGPTVKNVSGFDLVRLLVGSRGTLGVFGEVVLRCRPRPEIRRWMTGRIDPFELRDRLYRPGALLWDGTRAWLCVEGTAAEVDAELRRAGGGLDDCAGPPPLPATVRHSMRPSELRGLPAAAARAGGTPFVAEIGVGVVHAAAPLVGTRSVGAPALHRAVKERLDPGGRLAPGRSLGW